MDNIYLALGALAVSCVLLIFLYFSAKRQIKTVEDRNTILENEYKVVKTNYGALQNKYNLIYKHLIQRQKDVLWELYCFLDSPLGAKADGYTYQSFLVKKETGAFVERKQQGVIKKVQGVLGFIYEDSFVPITVLASRLLDEINAINEEFVNTKTLLDVTKEPLRGNKTK